jgi:hypothetical protein
MVSFNRFKIIQEISLFVLLILINCSFMEITCFLVTFILILSFPGSFFVFSSSTLEPFILLLMASFSFLFFKIKTQKYYYLFLLLNNNVLLYY